MMPCDTDLDFQGYASKDPTVLFVKDTSFSYSHGEQLGSSWNIELRKYAISFCKCVISLPQFSNYVSVLYPDGIQWNAVLHRNLAINDEFVCTQALGEWWILYCIIHDLVFILMVGQKQPVPASVMQWSLYSWRSSSELEVNTCG